MLMRIRSQHFADQNPYFAGKETRNLLLNYLDMTREIIEHQMNGEYDQSIDTFRDLVIWCWNSLIISQEDFWRADVLCKRAVPLVHRLSGTICGAADPGSSAQSAGEEKSSCIDSRGTVRLLNELAEPFGFAYLPSEDIFTLKAGCLAA